MRSGLIAAITSVLLAGSATGALAQDADSPLRNCKIGKLESQGPQGTDPKNPTDRILQGGVIIECDNTRVFAEDIRITPKQILASGNLLVQQPGFRVNAERMEMDRETHLGVFYNAYGTAKLTDKAPERDQFGTLEPEVAFRADRIERLGPRMYKLTNGSFSTCVQPNPRWEMRGTSGTIILGDRATLRNVGFFVKGVPVLFIPYLYYPLKEEDRSTGFLIPTYSYSELKGHGVSTAFFMALGRSHDATLYYDVFSSGSQGVGGDYRYMTAPGSEGELKIYSFYQNTLLAADGTVARAPHREFDVRGRVNQALPKGFRLIGDATYFSDVVTQQLYQQNVYDLTRSRRIVNFSVLGTIRARNRDVARLEATVRQQDFFQNVLSATRLGRTPQVNISFNSRELFKNSRVYYGGFAESAYIDSRPVLNDPRFDRSLWRFDGRTDIRATPTRWDYLQVSTGAAIRLTHWLESLDPLTLAPVPVPLTRTLIDLRANIAGPRFERVFQTPKNGYALRFKHLIEPRVDVQWLSPFDRAAQVIVTDPQIDSLVGGTTTVTYSLTNTVFARIRKDGGMREVFSVNIGQTYYSNPEAAIIDPNYPTRFVGTYTPVYVTASTTPTNTLSARFQMAYNTTARAVQSYSAQSNIDRGRFGLIGSWSKSFALQGASFPSHFVNATVRVSTRDKRIGGSYGFNWDLDRNALLQHRFMAFVNAQCCGITVDYQTVNFGLGGAPVATDRRFGVSFTLAGIGSFSNPLGSFRQ